MKNKPTLYLAKGERVQSGCATLKRVALADYFGFLPEISITPKGKAILTDLADYSFSVSHTEFLFCLFVQKGICGIDAEVVKERKNERIKNLFFTESESEKIKTLEDFYSLWVKKEAFGKLTGDGVYSQKRRELPEGIRFFDLSDILSDFYSKRVKGTISTFEEVTDIDVKVLEI